MSRLTGNLSVANNLGGRRRSSPTVPNLALMLVMRCEINNYKTLISNKNPNFNKSLKKRKSLETNRRFALVASAASSFLSSSYTAVSS